MSPKFPPHYRIQILRDTLFVLRGLWLLLLFNGLAAWALLCIPQGTDILQVLLEDSFDQLSFSPIFFLCLAVFFWCISSEFCTRFLLYMADNSGYHLSPERVRLRKRIQVLTARFFLFYPLFLLAISLLKAYFQNQSDAHFSLWVLVSILLILEIEWLILFYLYSDSKNKIFSKTFKWLYLSTDENILVNKLNGIFKEDQDPFIFYRNLITQLFVLSGLAVLLILVFSFLSNQAYVQVGAAALICFSFASWQALYAFLHFLDKAQPIKKWSITYRLLLLIWVLGCTYFNTDHPVRIYNNSPLTQQLTVQDHFEKWVHRLQKPNMNETIPVFFIAAEGGALRTGAFTALLLSKLQDSFPDFKNHIYAFSTVSGGGLGAHFFNSMSNVEPSKINKHHAALSRNFFAADFLSAVTGKLVFAEILQWMIPLYIQKFDRAITMEKVWEDAWQTTTGLDENNNAFAKPIAENNALLQPAYCINTVEAETGMPCVWSNLQLDSLFPFFENRNLQKRYPVTLRYSSAINLSTRFPLISPAAMFSYHEKGKQVRRHYVDGGYFDNSGQETLLQVLNAIPFEKYPQVKPYILCFNFSEIDTTIGKGIHFANDIVEIATAIYQTRNARTALAAEALKKYCSSRFSSGQYIALSLDINTKQLPMNWVLSNAALQRVDSYTDALMQMKKNKVDMQKIYSAITSP